MRSAIPESPRQGEHAALAGMLLGVGRMSGKQRILFLCKGNAARSQMAEAIMKQVGGRYFDPFSAGPDPEAAVHPQAIETLQRNHIPVDGLAPKDVSQLAGRTFDFVVCLCDHRNGEKPSEMPGADIIKWAFPDPAQGADEATRKRRFEDVFHGLESRIRLLMAVTTPRPVLPYMPAAA